MIAHMSEQLILAQLLKGQEYNQKTVSNLHVLWVGQNLTIYI